MCIRDRVAPAATDSPLRIAAAATGGNSGELLVYDPNGVPVGQYAMPLLDPANLTGASGSGRLLVVDGTSDATLPMGYSRTALPATNLRAQPVETLSGVLASTCLLYTSRCV